MRRSAGWLCLALLASVLILGCASTTRVTILVSPTTATVLANGVAQFNAAVTGSSTAPAWAVNGITGGNTTLGTVSTTGLYTAPATHRLCVKRLPP